MSTLQKYMNNKGYLLPIVLIFIVIAIILGMSILYLGGLEKIGSHRRLSMEKAFYIAEAGAWRAYTYLKEDIGWDWEEEGSGNLGGGTFDVVIEEDEDDRISIISEGTVNNVKRKVQLVLVSGGGNVWSRGLFGSIRIMMSNHAEIKGYNSSADPYGNSPSSDAQAGSLLLIQMSNNSAIKGDAAVTSAGDIILHNSAEITGEQIENNVFGDPFDTLPPVVIPSDLAALPYPVKSDQRFIFSGGKDWYWDLSNGDLNVWNNNAVLEITEGDYRFRNIYCSNGIIRFTGNSRIYVEQQINVSNNGKWDIQGSVVSYLGANSNFYVSNNAKIGIVQGNKVVPNLPENFRIYSASTSNSAVNFSNNSDIAGLLYVPRGRVDLNNNATFMGGIVTNILDVSNNATILYDSNLNNTEIPDDPGGGGGSSELTIIRWVKVKE